MQPTRKIIQIDEELCDGCGQCIPGCAEGALQIVDGKARIVAERYCDGLGACLGECPTGALQLVERPADEFDPVAVEAHLAALEKTATPARECPSQKVHELAPACDCANQARPLNASGASALGHWPIKIRLVPPDAPFLQKAHLLVAADCAAATLPDFNRTQLPQKVLLLGCPKFDNAQEYIARFRDIFTKADIQKVSVLIMEVPCCHGLPEIVRLGMQAAGKNIPTDVRVVARHGVLSLHSKRGDFPGQ